jgi:CheY-like chemotaxis protein
MQMPNLIGYDVAPIVRQMATFKDIPIWGLTAHEDPSEIQKVLAAGCDRCFTQSGIGVIRQIIADLTLQLLPHQTL